LRALQRAAFVFRLEFVHHFVAAASPRNRAPADLWRCAVCRNIKTLFNFEPPASDAEVRDASLQFVRKLSGFNAPSKANQAAFDRAVEEVAAAARAMLASMVTYAEPRNRDSEASKARARSALRFGPR